MTVSLSGSHAINVRVLQLEQHLAQRKLSSEVYEMPSASTDGSEVRIVELTSTLRM